MEGEECVIPDGSWMTAGEVIVYEAEEVVEASVVGEITERTDVAEMTRRRVSWKEERRSGHEVMSALELMRAFPSLTVVIASISARISPSKSSCERMWHSIQKDVATVLVVAT